MDKRDDPTASPVNLNAMMLLLTWAAGAVDALSYLGLGHVFTANMTGNIVLLGLALGQGLSLAALRNILALLGFVIGLAIGGMIVEHGRRPGVWSRALTTSILVEGAVLAAFSFTWRFPASAYNGAILDASIVLSAIAMGIQSAAVRFLAVPGVATTYITGTMTNLISELIAWLHPTSPRASIPKSAADKDRFHRRVRLQAAVFLLYGLAAVLSGFIQARAPALATFPPLLAIILVVVYAFSDPRSRPSFSP